MADGYLAVVYHGDDHGGPFTVEQFRRNVELIGEERDGDLSSFTPGVVRYANVADTEGEAWDELFEHLCYLERRYAEFNERDDPAKWDPKRISADREAALREGALVGTPETVCERLRRMDERVPGELHVVPRLYHPTRSVEEQEETVRRFGREVIAELD